MNRQDFQGKKMTDTISKAIEMARTQNKRRFQSVPDDYASEQPCPKAKSVDVPAAVMESSRLIGGITDQRVIDCFSLLRARVIHRVYQQDIKTLGVTSPSARDGKTLNTINLAISIALGETHPVLLVDADIRRPSIAQYFNLPIKAGLGDYLSGDANLEDVILKMPVKGLYVLPGRIESSFRPESLSPARMQEMMSELKAQVPGGLVIFDLSPALVGGDVVTMVPNLDAMLLVVADRRTDEIALNKTIPMLEGANVLGTVLNFADEITTSDDYYQ